MITAQVPPNVSEFLVSYDVGDQPAPVVAAQTPQPSPGQKLVLVRVPPGTVPGTTLHISIPDEPGRIISAVVPPNVSEFHVSYVPDYSRGARQAHSAPISDYQQNYSSDRGSFMLPLLSGAALGAAGVSMYDNYGLDQQYHDDTSGYQGDYGGGDDFGDFAGDF
jgi:hypothetical protein